MLRFLLNILLFIGLGGGLFAQKNKGLLLFESYNEQKDTSKKNFGPNRKHYAQFFYQHTQAFGGFKGDSIEYIAFRNPNHAFLIRYKLKLNKRFDLNFETGYEHRKFRISQNNKHFPDTLIYDSEKLVLNNLYFCPNLRFNFKKERGDEITSSIDIGAFASYTLFSKHQTKSNGFSKYSKQASTSTLEINPSYINKLTYGPFVRICFPPFAIIASYQMNSIFKQVNNYTPNCPVFRLGFEIELDSN